MTTDIEDLDERQLALTAKIEAPSSHGLELLDAADIDFYVYDHDITDEDFDDDTSLGWPAGRYYGVRLAEADADRWDTGIDACRARGVTGIDAYTLRLHVLRGGDPDDPVETWPHDDPVIVSLRDRRDTAVRSREDRQAERDAYDAHLAGLTDLGAHPVAYEANIYTAEELARLAIPQPAPPGMSAPPPATRRLLAHGRHIVEDVEGRVRKLWTDDPDLIADYERRSAIAGHVYDLQLAAALAELDDDGIRLPHGSWSIPRGFREDGWIPSYAARGRARTGDEQLERLRDYLDELAAHHPDLAERISAVKELAADGSIREVDAGLVGVSEVARITGLSVESVRTYVRRGTLPDPIEVAGSDALVWDRPAIVRWARSRPGRGRPPRS